MPPLAVRTTLALVLCVGGSACGARTLDEGTAGPVKADAATVWPPVVVQPGFFQAEGSPIMSGESYSYEYLDFVEVIGVMTQCKPENWKAALALIEQELRRNAEVGW